MLKCLETLEWVCMVKDILIIMVDGTVLILIMEVIKLYMEDMEAMEVMVIHHIVLLLIMVIFLIPKLLFKKLSKEVESNLKL